VAESAVSIAPLTFAAAWNVQGRSSQPFAHTVRALFDVDLPQAPNTTARSGALTALWLGPRSSLLAAGGASPLVDYAAKRNAINAVGGALFDVSAARVAWRIAGPCARDVLASGCPLDLDSREFADGACAQTLFGHVGVLVERRDAAFLLMAPRSYAEDVEHALATVAAQYGCERLAPCPYGASE
jgi:sarcosine oxidase subunit gamma